MSHEQVLPGTFQLAESGGPSGYAAKGWACVDNTDEGGALPAGAFSSASSRVTLAPDDDVTCTVTNEAIPGTFKVEKSSDPTDGAAVVPGQTVTYTVTVTHLDGVSPRNVAVTDDLSDVLDDATDFTVVSTTPAGTTVVGPTPENDQLLSWTIPQLDTTATIVYSVKVAPTAYGVTLRNVVVAPASSNCPTATSQAPECSTTHPTARWTLEKSSDPVTGSRVQPDSQITYTLEAVNISDAPVTGATVTDDLSDVLDDAVLDAVPAGATLSGTTLTWTVPTLAARGGLGHAELHGHGEHRRLAGDAAQRRGARPAVRQLCRGRGVRDHARHAGDRRCAGGGAAAGPSGAGHRGRRERAAQHRWSRPRLARLRRHAPHRRLRPGAGLASPLPPGRCLTPALDRGSAAPAPQASRAPNPCRWRVVALEAENKFETSGPAGNLRLTTSSRLGHR